MISCDCGETREMKLANFMKLVKQARPASCGCRKAELQRKAHRTHGMAKHPAYAVWRSMRVRCEKPSHPAWHNYGGRGITVCAEWQSFDAFWADMGSDYAPGLTLDREDNSAGYSAENCRWVTMKDQARNRRKSRMVATPWGVITAAEMAERCGVGYTTILYRLSKGVKWPELATKPDVTRTFTISSTAARESGLS